MIKLIQTNKPITIYFKRCSRVPLDDSELERGELLFDILNKRVYIKILSGQIIEITHIEQLISDWTELTGLDVGQTVIKL